MGTLDNGDIRLFNMSFNVCNQKPHYLELKSKSGQFWCVYKEDDELVILLHMHHDFIVIHIILSARIAGSTATSLNGLNHYFVMK